jgi:hypothetical protein
MMTKNAEANASIYAGTVPCTDGMSTNEFSGITVQKRAINQPGSPLIEVVSVAVLFIA